MLVHGHGAYAGWEWLLHASPVRTEEATAAGSESATEATASSTDCESQMGAQAESVQWRVHGGARYDGSWVQALNAAGFSVSLNSSCGLLYTFSFTCSPSPQVGMHMLCIVPALFRLVLPL